MSDKLNSKIKSLTSFISTNFAQPAVTIDSKIISSNKKDLNYLKHIDSKKYITERAPILVSFLEGITSKNHCNPILLAVVGEAIYHLKNSNLILPHCFLTNLVETFISGPTIVQLMEKLVDNIRKYIVKSYRVPSERNNSLNVITAIINIELQKEQNSKENIQYIENLKPVY